MTEFRLSNAKVCRVIFLMANKNMAQHARTFLYHRRVCTNELEIEMSSFPALFL